MKPWQHWRNDCRKRELLQHRKERPNQEAQWRAEFERLARELAFYLGDDYGRFTFNNRPSHEWYAEHILREWHPGRLLHAAVVAYRDPRTLPGIQSWIFQEELSQVWAKANPNFPRRFSKEWEEKMRSYHFHDGRATHYSGEFQPANAAERAAIERTRQRVQHHTRTAWREHYRSYRQRDDLGNPMMCHTYRYLTYLALNWSPTQDDPERLP